MPQLARPQLPASPDGPCAGGGRPIPHHILCAGRPGIAFARLSAAALWAGSPEEFRNRLNIFVHLDAISEKEAREVAEWLSDAPAVRVTFGLFGIKTAGKAINWHQHMINRVAALFQNEPRIAFVDADLFITDSAWWEVAAPKPAAPDLYAETLGLRKERRMVLGQEEFFAMKTALFTLNPALHLAINTQAKNSDITAARRLAREFPGAALSVGKFVDTMVIPSLRAQALGWRVEDLTGKVGACHVGGFSHISAKKLLAGESTVTRENWLRRLRLLERVIALLVSRGWDRFLDPAHLATARKMREAVNADTALREAAAALKPSPDEKAFENLRL